jgi:hypothetical protein
MKNLFKSGVLLCLLWLGYVPGFTLLGQNGNKSPISFQAKNESVREVLSRLSEHETLNLTYNATDAAFDELVSYTAKEKATHEILREILLLIDHEYQQMGNHLLIVRSENYNPSKNQLSQNAKVPATSVSISPGDQLKSGNQVFISPPDTIIRQVEVPVYLRDTLVVFDTIIQFEVQTIRDTVFIEKAGQAPRSGNRRSFGGSISNGAFRFEADRDNSFALGFYLAPALAGYQYREMLDVLPSLRTEDISARNIAFGLDMLYNKNRWQLSLGASLNSYATRFDYNEVNSTGGFFLIDTLDVFYTIIDQQPLYTYITDSTWIPLNRDELVYDRLNRMGLLNINLGVAYTFYRTSNFDYYLKGSMQMGVPLWLKGNTIIDSNGFPATELDNNQFSNWLLGYSAALGMRYQLGNWIDVYAEPVYKRYLTPTTINHPLKRRLHGFGLQLGMMYYF